MRSSRTCQCTRRCTAPGNPGGHAVATRDLALDVLFSRKAGCKSDSDGTCPPTTPWEGGELDDSVSMGAAQLRQVRLPHPGRGVRLTTVPSSYLHLLLAALFSRKKGWLQERVQRDMSAYHTLEGGRARRQYLGGCRLTQASPPTSPGREARSTTVPSSCLHPLFAEPFSRKAAQCEAVAPTADLAGARRQVGMAGMLPLHAVCLPARSCPVRSIAPTAAHAGARRQVALASKPPAPPCAVVEDVCARCDPSHLPLHTPVHGARSPWQAVARCDPSHLPLHTPVHGARSPWQAVHLHFFVRWSFARFSIIVPLRGSGSSCEARPLAAASFKSFQLQYNRLASSK